MNMNHKLKNEATEAIILNIFAKLGDQNQVSLHD